MPAPTGPFVEAQAHHAATVRQLRERLADERRARIAAERKLDRVVSAVLARQSPPLELLRAIGIDPGRRAA